MSYRPLSDLPAGTEVTLTDLVSHRQIVATTMPDDTGTSTYRLSRVRDAAGRELLYQPTTIARVIDPEGPQS